MKRTKGRLNMEKMSNDRSMVRTRTKISDAALYLMKIVECNAIGYHCIHKDWLHQQSLKTKLVYCHPLDRKGYIYKLMEEGVNI